MRYSRATGLATPFTAPRKWDGPRNHFGAEAFAYLAVRSMRKLPLSFPGTTGVKQPMTDGMLARAPRR